MDFTDPGGEGVRMEWRTEEAEGGGMVCTGGDTKLSVKEVRVGVLSRVFFRDSNRGDRSRYVIPGPRGGG